MNRDAVDAQALLRIALDTVRGELLPALPSDRRYAALMTANALAIAARALAHREDADRTCRAALASLYGEPAGSAERADALHERAEALRRRLCADIAAGRFDGAGPELPAALESVVRAQLAITNPKALGPS